MSWGRKLEREDLCDYSDGVGKEDCSRCSAAKLRMCLGAGSGEAERGEVCN